MIKERKINLRKIPVGIRFIIERYGLPQGFGSGRSCDDHEASEQASREMERRAKKDNIDVYDKQYKDGKEPAYETHIDKHVSDEILQDVLKDFFDSRN